MLGNISHERICNTSSSKAQGYAYDMLGSNKDSVAM